MEQPHAVLGGLTRAQAVDQIWPVFKRIEKLQWTILGIVTGWGIRELLGQLGVGRQETLHVMAKAWGWM